MVGMAYLDLYAVTQDESFLNAAIRIADTLKKTQFDDGRWYFRVDPQTGKMLEDYTSDQVESILLLDELIRNHKRKDLVETRDKAVRWMLANPCKTFHWQQQWDDVKTLAPYENLEWYDTGLFIEYLLRYATPENGYAKIALELLYYIDDQFIEWEPSGEYITPGAREQYVCYHIIDWHTAHYIRVCMAFHRHTKDEAYLRKACAMADTLTVIQHPDGFYPTWMRHKPARDNPRQLRDINYSDTWANCSSYTGEILMKLGVYLKEMDSWKK
jgi:maltose/maltodextrin transport system substrate-binding protein